MRRRHEEIEALGAGIVAIGTGDERYARAFIEDEEIPFPVFLDELGEAAEIASLKRGGWLQLAGPQTMPGAMRATAGGHRQHRTGKRPKQLGATFVIGPGDALRYEHVDKDVSDHAPIDEVLTALSGS